VLKQTTIHKILSNMFIAALALVLSSCAGTGVANTVPASQRTGVVNGRFLPCPGSPNCVSSMETFGRAAIAPLDYGPLSRDQALRRLLDVLEADKSCLIVESSELENGGYYLRAEYRSRLFRFVDDVEFLLVPESNLVHVRSASRIGYSDMGVNRKRVEDIRRRFIQG